MEVGESMKKRITVIFLVLLILASKVFAGIDLRANLALCGLYTEVTQNPFNEYSSGTENSFTILGGLPGEIDALYDFNPDGKFHVDLGISLSYLGVIMAGSADLGTSIQVSQTEKHIFDFYFLLKYGYMMMLDDINLPYSKIDLGIKILPAARKGFYFAPGITNVDYFWYTKYEGFKDYLHLNNYLVFQFAVGYMY